MENRASRDAAILETIKRSVGANLRPLLLTGGTVLTMNPLMGDWECADVLIVGGVIAGVGPHIITSAEDDQSIVIDCAGMVVLPATVDYAVPNKSGTLTSGNAANVAVLKRRNPVAYDTLAGVAASHLDLLLLDGQVQVWNGRPLAATPLPAAGQALQDNPADSQRRVGMWVDGNDLMKQELLPNGRYDEGRGDRKSAYQGRYWITGNRIDYLDDLGFWAFGEFKGDTLEHAGYKLTKQG